jgi:ABC-type multidrug transport system fused ATPase/permease subunit
MSTRAELKSLVRLFATSISRREKRKIQLLIFVQIGINLVDLVGVALLGIVGALTISGIQSQLPSKNILNLLKPINLDESTFQVQVSVLALSATLLLISRTLLSLYLSKKTFDYFASKSILFSSAILKNLFKDGLEKSQSKSTQEVIYATTTGCDLLLIGVLAQGTVLLSDLTLLVFMGSAVAFLQPATAIVSILIFGCAGAYMHFVLNAKSKTLGQIGASQAIVNGRKIQQLFASFREVYTLNRSSYFISEITNTRTISARTQSEINFLPLLNKHFLESTLLLGALAVSAVEFVLHDARQAIFGLTIFLASGSRIAPALLRVQQNLLNIRNSLGGAAPTLESLKGMELEESEAKNENQSSMRFQSTPPEIVLRNLRFQYHGGSKEVLRGIDLVVPSATTLAITGPSGSGKTTLVDLILGVLTPTNGEVTLNGLNPQQVIQSNSINVSYVPQEVQLMSSSLIENIALGVPVKEISEDRIHKAIELAQLKDFVDELPHGIATILGEGGVLVSGGQKQRIGIARALYRKSTLIIFDEPTSSLDGLKEEFIASAIDSLKGSATIVVIAHRLNTLKNVDKVLYLENGLVSAEGSFSDIQSKVNLMNPDILAQ